MWPCRRLYKRVGIVHDLWRGAVTVAVGASVRFKERRLMRGAGGRGKNDHTPDRCSGVELIAEKRPQRVRQLQRLLRVSCPDRACAGRICGPLSGRWL